MKFLKLTLLPILISTVWVSVNEFIRNQLVLQHYWLDHYGALGVAFPQAPVNGAVWGVWALVFSIMINMISRNFGFWKVLTISWVMGFVLMWLVIGNMGVLPFGILWMAVPWSMLEVAGACFIMKKLNREKF